MFFKRETCSNKLFLLMSIVSKFNIKNLKAKLSSPFFYKLLFDTNITLLYCSKIKIFIFHVVLFPRSMRLWFLIKRIKWILIGLKITLKPSRQTIYFVLFFMEHFLLRNFLTLKNLLDNLFTWKSTPRAVINLMKQFSSWEISLALRSFQINVCVSMSKHLWLNCTLN